MKLRHYAKHQGISYSTALRWLHAGALKGYQAPSGTIIVVEANQATPSPERVAISVYSFCARLYGQRRAKRKTERLVEQLQARNDDHAGS